MGKKRKRMGRPPLENPRNTLISLKVTARERAELAKAAKAAGMSLSAYIMAPHRKKRKG